MPDAPRGPVMYLDKTRTKIVPAGSPQAAFMYHERDLRAMGIDPSKAQVQEAEQPAAEQSAEEKAQEPAATKARRGAEDK